MRPFIPLLVPALFFKSATQAGPLIFKGGGGGLPE